MSKQVYSAVCTECGNLTKVPFFPDGIRPCLCADCLAMKNGKGLPNIVKQKTNFQKGFKVKLEKDEQILAALDTVGEAFRHHGGSTLMLTEHVENGIDAIEDLTKIKKLKNPHDGKIEIIIDEDKSRVIVIDNGTGIIDPIWIMENPLKSRKTGESHQHGEFGRGLQGFRGFCKNLEYITTRDEVSKKELADDDIRNYLEEGKGKGLDGKCIKLELCRETIETIYQLVSIKEFEKYTKNSIGTVVIFSNWLPGDFEALTRDKTRLFDRIQHHFRVPLEKKVVEITLINGKPKPIELRSFSIDGEEMDLFDLPDRKVINPYTKQEYGTIQFRFFQAAPRYNHRYKAPFLLVGDRPLGNSELIKLEELSDENILKSPYLTGYIVANFLKPDSLRLSPKPGEEYKRFISLVQDTLCELKPMLDVYEEGFRVVNKNEENNLSYKFNHF